jgi:hypothetical protein
MPVSENMQSHPKIAMQTRGAHNWTRTSDLSLTKGVLYHLSYAGVLCSAREPLPQMPLPQMMERVMGIEPTSSAWKAEVLPLNYTRPGRQCLTGQIIQFYARDTIRFEMVEGGGFEPPKA